MPLPTTMTDPINVRELGISSKKAAPIRIAKIKIEYLNGVTTATSPTRIEETMPIKPVIRKREATPMTPVVCREIDTQSSVKPSNPPQILTTITVTRVTKMVGVSLSNRRVETSLNVQARTAARQESE